MAIDFRGGLTDEEYAERRRLLRINEAEQKDQLDVNGEPPIIFGPFYKQPTCAYFWPRGSKGYETMMESSIVARADVLFGVRSATDGFDESAWRLKDSKQRPNYLESSWEKKDDGRKPFKIVPSKFMLLARDNPPEKPEATVSAFASWIYSLYSNAYGDDEDKERGKEIEPRIFQQRMRAEGGVDNSFLNGIGSDWRLIHNGLHMPGDEIRKWFTIDDLRVNGEAMRALPDLIYRNQRWNEVIIVEIKHSFMTIPSNLWPNIWAQLWCYAQLEGSRRADRLTVVGEVWGERKYWARREPERNMLHLRASERRDPRAPAYDRFFRTLFSIYSGSKA